MLNIFIIDDSVLFRTKITKEIESKTNFRVIGTANDVVIAQKRLTLLSKLPDIIILDVELPGINGLEYLEEKLSKLDTKIIVCTSFYEKYHQEAKKLGAIKVLDKNEALSNIIETLESIDSLNVVDKTPIIKRNLSAVVAIGASTGGLDILYKILTSLPSQTPPILIIQHISRDISHTFIPKLQKECKVDIKVAKDNESIEKNTVYFAPFSKHLLIKKIGLNRYVTILDNNDNLAFHKPSIDVLFKSMAQEVRSNSVAFILTGMGNDGVEGIKEIKYNSGKTFAQDEYSCTVFGMPKAAIEAKVIDKVVTPKEIVNIITNI